MQQKPSVRFHLVAAFFILLGCLAPQTSRALALKASDGRETPVSLGGHLAVLHDPTGTLTIEDVAAGRAANQFQAVPSMLTQGYRKGAIWVRFSLSAPKTSQPWLLQIERPLIENVTLFVPDGRGGFAASAPTGDNLLRNENAALAYPALFPVPVSSVETEYYLRLQSSTSITTALRIWQKDGYERYRRSDLWIMGMVLGAIGAMILANLLYAYLLRETLYLLYVAVLIESGLISTFHMGYASEIFRILLPSQIHYLWGIVVCLYSIVLVSFMGRLFDFRYHWIWGWRIIQGIVILNSIALLFAIAGHYGNVGFFVSRLQQISHLFIGAYVFYLIVLRRQNQHMLGALAFSVMALALFVMQGQYTGSPLLAIDSSLARLLAAGTLTHLVLLSAAVAQRARLAEVGLSEEKDRIIAIAQSAERELSVKVRERTAELAERNVSLADEVNQRHLLELKLRQSLDSVNDALAQQRDFVALVSHEFRAPLAVIAAAADNLATYADESADSIKSRAARIRHTVKRMSMLIENVLAGDRLDGGLSAPATMRMLDLNEILRTTLAGLDDDATARVEILSGNETMVRGDPALLEVALQNLIQNALKYSPASSLVTVKVSTERTMALIDVADRGIGVAPDDRERIFTKYFRAAGQQAKGSGLGLYISREIARQHDGDLILAASDAGGTVFRLSVPIEEAVPAPPQSRSSEASSRR